MNYYNEYEPFAADWLRNLITEGLIPNGEVDTRSICDVQATDLLGYRQCHFFTGIGGWSRALELAGWPADREVWTGSAPCQPFSTAGKQKGTEDKRHLWPVFADLIRQRQPEWIFGEQVSAAIRLGWIDGVRSDLEGAGYAFGFTVLGAHSVGAPHIRQRIFWGAKRVSDASGERIRTEGPGCNGSASVGMQGTNWEWERIRADAGNDGSGLLDSAGSRWAATGGGSRIDTGRESVAGYLRAGGGSGLPNADEPILRGQSPAGQQSVHECDGRDVPGRSWSDYTIDHYRDGKSRRIGRSIQPLVDGIPSRRDDSRLAYLRTRLEGMGHSSRDVARILKQARQHRTGVLKGAGNAIVAPVAAIFIKSFMESIHDR